MQKQTSGARQRMAQCRRHSPSSHAATGIPIESLAVWPCCICRIGSRLATAPPCSAPYFTPQDCPCTF